MKVTTTMAVLAVALLAVQGVASGAENAKASPCAAIVRITELMFDPAGTEVDGEWVEMANLGNTSADISGWTLTDQDGSPEIVFQNVVMAPGQMALVHTGKGLNGTDANGTLHFYINRTTSVWNNPGDDALLTTANGTVEDFMSYGNGTAVDGCPGAKEWVHASTLPEEGFSLALADEPIGTWLPRTPSPGRANGAPSFRGNALISKVCYAPEASSEFVSISSNGATNIDLSGWQLSDGEGTMAFPCGASLNGTLTVAQNASQYKSVFNSTPDFSWSQMLKLHSGFGLANHGDEVFLADPWGMSQDVYAFGDSTYAGLGWTGSPAAALANGKISTRFCGRQGFADSNTSADWDVAGAIEPNQTVEDPGSYESGNTTVAVLPDAGRQIAKGFVESAVSSILLNIYEIDEPETALWLARAAQRGVKVKALFEAEPVGGLDSATTEICDALAEAGVEVRLMASKGAREAYKFDHAKYMVADGRAVYVATENWSPNGLPAEGKAGNRGWVVTAENESLAGSFTQVFEHDWNNLTTPWAQLRGGLELKAPQTYEEPDNFTAKFPPLALSGKAIIKPVFAPDNSLSDDTILGMIYGARKEICVEQFYIYKDWGNGDAEVNPFLDALLGAARRGVGVRILMDNSWFDSTLEENQQTALYVNTIAALEGLNISAKLVNSEAHGFTKIHAKGMVADRSVALVSSINWCRNSVMENREAGLIIRSAEAGEYFAKVFDYDWKDDVRAPIAEIRAPWDVETNASVELSANGSWDDQGIKAYEWRVDGVRAKCSESALVWMFRTPGEHVVELTVTDAWGNSDTTNVSLEVKPRSTMYTTGSANADSALDGKDGQNSAVGKDGDAAGTGAPWSLAMLSIPGVVLVGGWAMAARRAKKPSKRGKER